MRHLSITNLLLIFCTICFLSFSCRKNNTKCNGTCADINVSGKIYNKINGAGIGNAPVTLNWFARGLCLFCSKYELYNSVTKSDGSFNFNVTIDTSFFTNHNLTLRIPKDTNYLSSNNIGGVNFYEQRLYNFDARGLQNINFELYPKTRLLIKVQRTQNDAFTYYTLAHTIIDNSGSQDFSVQGQQNSRDTILNVVTAAGVFTKVISTKITSGILTSQKVDSIFCTQNGNNFITINY